MSKPLHTNYQENPQSLSLAEDAAMPNNPFLPVLLYKHLVPERTLDKAALFEQRFMAHGWTGIWRDSVFDYHHFHSHSHEVMGIAAGSAVVKLGGESGVLVDVEAGDMLILPAGTGHKKIEASADFLVVGAYPRGQEDYDICRSKTGHNAVEKKIAAVKLPKADPFYGAGGPLTEIWHEGGN